MKYRIWNHRGHRTFPTYRGDIRLRHNSGFETDDDTLASEMEGFAFVEVKELSPVPSHVPAQVPRVRTKKRKTWDRVSTMGELYKQAKEKGIQVSFGMKREELENLIKEAS